MNKLPSHLYGESIFTTTRTINGVALFESMHLERLLTQVSEYYFLGRVEAKQLANYFDVKNKLRVYSELNPNHIVRATFYANPRGELVPKSFAISDLVFELSSRTLSSRQNLKLKIMPSPFSEFKSSIKAGSYFQNFYFKRLAMVEGYDDILFHRDDNLTESSTSNLVFEKNGVLTTPRDASIFYGIGLSVLEAAGFEIEKRIIHLSELSTFSSVYLVNSVQPLSEVSKIDDYTFTNSESRSMLDEIDLFLRSQR